MKMFSLNLGGRLVEFRRAAVMAIVNATPDSFFAGSRAATADEVARRTETLLEEGADIIDLGACSTRPGSESPDADEELRRLEPALEAIRKVSPTVPVSVDTFRASVAERCVRELGADIINDISGGTLDERMFDVVAQTRAPYVMMHTRGTPVTMQSLTDYSAEGGVTSAVLDFFARRTAMLADRGVADIIIDPGFGLFAKTTEQNWELMRELPALQALGRPVLAGISRKSMLTRPLGISADHALAATVAANVMALERGASIIRVHDVAAARQAVAMVSLIEKS